jgi:hypothetical protein
MWSLALIGLNLLLIPIYYWMKKEYEAYRSRKKEEYEAYQSRKKKNERYARRCHYETIPRVSKWIDDFLSGSDKLNRLVQRHIYLIDEIDHLQKQLAQSVSVCVDDIDHDDEKLKSLQQDVESTIQEIWLQKQDLGHLVTRLEAIPEAWDFYKHFFSDEYEDRFRHLKCCTIGGCCGRQCRCCDKPRRTAAGEAFRYWSLRGGSKDVYAHCTEECACCRRYWGFSRVIREDDGSLTCVK